MKNNCQIAYEFIFNAICNGTFQPGSVVAENWLGEKLNMSRTPVREALIRLQSEGLISVINNRATVTTITPIDIEEIFQLRLRLEPFAAAICIDRINKEKVKAIRELSVERLKKGNITFSVDIYDLHNLIIESTRNKRLISIVKNLQSQVTRLLKMCGNIPGRLVRSIEEHLLIMDAILAGDHSMAEHHMKCHIKSNMDDMLNVSNYHYFFKD